MAARVRPGGGGRGGFPWKGNSATSPTMRTRRPFDAGGQERLHGPITLRKNWRDLFGLPASSQTHGARGYFPICPAPPTSMPGQPGRRFCSFFSASGYDFCIFCYLRRCIFHIVLTQHSNWFLPVLLSRCFNVFLPVCFSFYNGTAGVSGARKRGASRQTAFNRGLPKSKYTFQTIASRWRRRLGGFMVESLVLLFSCSLSRVGEHNDRRAMAQHNTNTTHMIQPPDGKGGGGRNRTRPCQSGSTEAQLPEPQDWIGKSTDVEALLPFRSRHVATIPCSCNGGGEGARGAEQGQDLHPASWNARKTITPTKRRLPNHMVGSCYFLVQNVYEHWIHLHWWLWVALLLLHKTVDHSALTPLKNTAAIKVPPWPSYESEESDFQVLMSSKVTGRSGPLKMCKDGVVRVESTAVPDSSHTEELPTRSSCNSTPRFRHLASQKSQADTVFHDVIVSPGRHMANRPSGMPKNPSSSNDLFPLFNLVPHPQLATGHK